MGPELLGLYSPSSSTPMNAAAERFARMFMVPS
jgi:hypothetical protein